MLCQVQPWSWKTETMAPPQSLRLSRPPALLCKPEVCCLGHNILQLMEAYSTCFLLPVPGAQQGSGIYRTKPYEDISLPCPTYYFRPNVWHIVVLSKGLLNERVIY